MALRRIRAQDGKLEPAPAVAARADAPETELAPWAGVLDLQRGVGNAAVSRLIAGGAFLRPRTSALLQRQDFQLEKPEIGSPLYKRKPLSLLGDRQLTLNLSAPPPFTLAPKTLYRPADLPEWLRARGQDGGGTPSGQPPQSTEKVDPGKLEMEHRVVPDLDPRKANDPASRLDGTQYKLELSASWIRADRSWPDRFRTALGDVTLFPGLGVTAEVGLDREHAIAAEASLKMLSLHLHRNWGEISGLVGAGAENLGHGATPSGSAGLEFERGKLKIEAKMKATKSEHGVEFSFESVFAVGGHF